MGTVVEINSASSLLVFFFFLVWLAWIMTPLLPKNSPPSVGLMLLMRLYSHPWSWAKHCQHEYEIYCILSPLPLQPMDNDWMTEWMHQVRGAWGSVRVRGHRTIWRSSAECGGVDPVRPQRARGSPGGWHHGQVFRVRGGQEPARQPWQAHRLRQGTVLLFCT